MQLIAFGFIFYLLRCGRSEIIYLKNLNFPANGAPNFEAKNDNHIKKEAQDFSRSVDQVTYEGSNVVPHKQSEYSKMDNQIINIPMHPKSHATMSDEAKNIQIVVIQPDPNDIQLAENELNELNLYKRLTDNVESEDELSGINAGAFLLRILSSLRKNREVERDFEKPKELGFNIYVPISDDIVNPPFLPRESIEKIIHKNGLPLIDLKGDRLRITN